MDITALGDSALIIRLRETLDDPRRALAQVLSAVETLRRAGLPGVQEITPSFVSIGVFFDPTKVEGSEEMPNEWLSKKIEAVLKQGKGMVVKPRRARLIEIPVCYEKIFAPDLSLVAENAKMTTAEVLRLHSAPEYRVHAIGFTPGFAYLSGLSPKLTTPRRDIPRQEVPAGSVAIGGEQTGVYPQTSPGGWNIIGRSPLRFFDPHSAPPSLLQAGDHVRFRAISLAQFHAATTR